MRAILLVLLLWSPARAELARRAPVIDVIARVTQAPPGPILCGVIATHGIVRFDVIEVKVGTLQQRQIFVEVLCPEAYDIGSTYRLTIAPIREKTQPARRHRIVREKRLRK